MWSDEATLRWGSFRPDGLSGAVTVSQGKGTCRELRLTWASSPASRIQSPALSRMLAHGLTHDNYTTTSSTAQTGKNGSISGRAASGSWQSKSSTSERVLSGITRNIYSAKTRHKAVQVARHTFTEVTAPAWGQRVTEGRHDFLVSCQTSTPAVSYGPSVRLQTRDCLT